MNEPSGFVPLAGGERTFDSCNEGPWVNAWGPSGCSNSVKVVDVSSVTHPTTNGYPTGGMVSPCNAMEWLYPKGKVGGTSPGTTEVATATIRGTGWHKIYVDFHFLYSNNWQGHLSLVNKMLFLAFGTNGNQIIVMGRGSGQNPLRAHVGLQGLVSYQGSDGFYCDNAGPSACSPNLPTLAGLGGKDVIARNKWYRIEALAEANTPGKRDGSMRLWLNGAKITEETGIEFASAAMGTVTDKCSLSPTWGGTGDSVAQAQYWLVDQFYVSGSK